MPTPEPLEGATMSNHDRKTRIRQYMADHGVNYTTAKRALESATPVTPPSTEPTSLGPELRSALPHRVLSGQPSPVAFPVAGTPAFEEWHRDFAHGNVGLGLGTVPVLQPGSAAQFTGDRRWWTVRAADARFAVCTRQGDFVPAGTLWYCIVDADRKVRGPVNLVGHGWGDGSYSDEQCAALLSALQSGEVEVTHRNPAPLGITATR